MILKTEIDLFGTPNNHKAYTVTVNEKKQFMLSFIIKDKENSIIYEEYIGQYDNISVLSRQLLHYHLKTFDFNNIGELIKCLENISIDIKCKNLNTKNDFIYG